MMYWDSEETGRQGWGVEEKTGRGRGDPGQQRAPFICLFNTDLSSPCYMSGKMGLKVRQLLVPCLKKTSSMTSLVVQQL